MNAIEMYDTLRNRMEWLTVRAAGKAMIGWEHQYDERERDSIKAALPILYESLTGQEQAQVDELERVQMALARTMAEAKRAEDAAYFARINSDSHKDRRRR